MKKMKIMLSIVVLMLFAVNTYAANGDLTVNGTLNVGAGGVKFPDGTTQTTAISPTTQNNVTASRTLGTVYRNTTGKPMWVSVCGIAIGQVPGNIFTFSDSSATPTTDMGVVTIEALSPGHRACVSFLVLPNNYYKSTSDGGVTLSRWIESY